LPARAYRVSSSSSNYVEVSVLVHVFIDYFITFVLIIIAASWAISVYFAYQRTWKPFNPILGETYEMANHGGVTFLAEQVPFMYVTHKNSVSPHLLYMFSWKFTPAFARTVKFFSLLSFALLGEHIYGIFIFSFLLSSPYIGYLDATFLILGEPPSPDECWSC